VLALRVKRHTDMARVAVLRGEGLQSN